MRSVKLTRRLLALALCVLSVLPVLATGQPTEENSVSAASGVYKTVRVGLCLPEKDTGVFVSSAVSESGFSAGTYSESTRSFSSLFGLSSTALALFPDRNAAITFTDGTATGKASGSGNFGAYNLTTGKRYASYSEARAAANKLTDGFVACTDAGYEVRYGMYLSEQEAQAAVRTSGHKVACPVSGGLTVADCNTGKIVLEYECSVPFALRSVSGGTVSLNTVSKRYSYLGFFVFTAGSQMKVLNVLDLETYVKCVMANEIGTNVSVETRRAFSVLIRTVPLNSKHDEYGCDVCNSTCCQVYLGTYRRDAENDAIVDSTRGEYVTYEGAPISCLYHNSNGGASCSSAAAWGGSGRPYLTSVVLEEDDNNQSAVWQYTFTEEELYAYLSSRSAFSDLEGGVSEVEIVETDPYGSSYVTLLSVTDIYNNTCTVSTSEKVRTTLNFESANFTVSYSTTAEVVAEDGSVSSQSVGGYIDADGNYVAFDSFAQYPVAGSAETAGADVIVFDGVGTGHGVGFSSNGSEQLVGEGYSYRYIIQFYFNGTEISHIS